MLPDYTCFTPFELCETSRKMRVNEDNLKLYWYWIFERQNIWHKRFILEKPSPWTDDPILQYGKFTNCYRELDKGTIYLKNQILDRFDGTDATSKKILFNILAYRYLNRWEAWDKYVGFINEWNSEAFTTPLNAAKASGETVFTAAHMIPPLYNIPGETKVDRVAVLLDDVWKNLNDFYAVVQRADTVELIFNWIHNIPWFGKFLSYEMAVDICYTNITEAHENSWVNSGPGCFRGLQWIFPDLKSKSNSKLEQNLLKRLHNEQLDAWEKYNLPFSTIAYKNRYMTLRNIEHSSCEYSKYMKSLTGQRSFFEDVTGARVKQNFHQTTETSDKWFNLLKG